MGFSDEVEAAKSAEAQEKTRRRELQEPAQIRFEAELRELWVAADEYWRENAEIVDLALARWVYSGELGKLGEKGPAPFPRVRAFDRPRTRADWETGAHVPSDFVEGLSINNWFVLCAPGELRELAIIPDIDPRLLFKRTAADEVEILRRFRQAHQQSYLQGSWPSVRSEVIGDDGSTFGMAFVGPEGEPDLVLRCRAEGPIEIFGESVHGWERLGTLREQVVSAVASMPE